MTQPSPSPSSSAAAKGSNPNHTKSTCTMTSQQPSRLRKEPKRDDRPHPFERWVNYLPSSSSPAKTVASTQPTGEKSRGNDSLHHPPTKDVLRRGSSDATLDLALDDSSAIKRVSLDASETWNDRDSPDQHAVDTTPRLDHDHDHDDDDDLPPDTDPALLGDTANILSCLSPVHTTESSTLSQIIASAAPLHSSSHNDDTILLDWPGDSTAINNNNEGLPSIMSMMEDDATTATATQQCHLYTYSRRGSLASLMTSAQSPRRSSPPPNDTTTAAITTTTEDDIMVCDADMDDAERILMMVVGNEQSHVPSHATHSSDVLLLGVTSSPLYLEDHDDDGDDSMDQWYRECHPPAQRHPPKGSSTLYSKRYSIQSKASKTKPKHTRPVPTKKTKHKSQTRRQREPRNPRSTVTVRTTTIPLPPDPETLDRLFQKRKRHLAESMQRSLASRKFLSQHVSSSSSVSSSPFTPQRQTSLARVLDDIHRSSQQVSEHLLSEHCEQQQQQTEKQHEQSIDTDSSRSPIQDSRDGPQLPTPQPFSSIP